MLNPYCGMDATAIVELIDRGKLGVDQPVRAALREIERSNPMLNAVVELQAEAALDQVRRGLPDGPLKGVPILLKDLGTAAAGLRTTYGSALFEGARAWTHDSAIVRRLRDAGAVILGRTNCAEYGISLTSEPQFCGPVRNPHVPGASAGGSSGGSAAAVAAGMVPLAHATDGCGSIRVPASHCGLYGLKPTRGRVSLGPDAAEGWAGMSTTGGLTRSLRDTALLLDVLSGPEPGEPHHPPLPRRPYREEIGEAPAKLRIGLVQPPDFAEPTARACLAAVEEAAHRLAGEGHELEPVSLDFDLDEAIGPLQLLWGAQIWSIVKPRFAELGRDPDGWGMEPLSWACADHARARMAEDYLDAVRFIHSAARRLARSAAGVDALLSPVSAVAELPLGVNDTSSTRFDDYARWLFGLYPYTVQFNITGQPALSIPMAVGEGAVPVGVQLVGPFGREDLLIRLASQLQPAGTPGPAGTASLETTCPS